MPNLRRASLIVLLFLSLLLSNYTIPVLAQGGPKKGQPPKPTAQTSPPPPPQEKAPDYSQEAFIIEQFKTLYRFERDGTGQREWRVRVRIQSDAGVQQFGQLVFPYSAGNEKLDIENVNVRKADGTVVTASASDVQDLTSPVSREAPVYTDLRTKHVTVPGLRPGDVLEYHVVWHVHTALAQNNFWLEHNFLPKDAISLDEQLEVNIPSESVMKLKFQPGFDAVVKDQQGRRIYTWKYANKKREEKKEGEPAKTNADDEPKPPQVQMTTFQNWNDVGQWYAGLERDRIVPNDKIKAEAASQTRGLVDDKKKIEALYAFVSKNFRYVSLSFGQGRYQPHAASDVLTNQYGDCKDKHTLLAAMLSAVGLSAYPVLMNSSRKIDPDLPSPGQFDHVISAIPFGNELLWVDTTTEVAPFRLLAPPIRDKQGLMIPAEGPARLETTPGEPPFRSVQVVETVGQVNDLGKLTGHARLIFRGDLELYVRLMFRKTPRSDWKSLNSILAAVGGLESSDFSEMKTTEIADTEKPFEVEFDFSIPNFLDWSSKKLKIGVPMPSLHLNEVDADTKESSKPLQLGAPVDITYRLKLTLPSKYQKRMPLSVNVTRDYAEYRSSYKLEGNTLTAERMLNLRQRELPASRTQDYVAFTASTNADEAQVISLETTVVGAPSIPESAKADELVEAAIAAEESGNYVLAETLLRRALEKEPKHKQARRYLGWALFAQRKYDAAIEVLREQTKINPFDDYCYNLLGQVFWQQQKYQDAEAAFRKQLEVMPLNSYAKGNLGLMLLDWRKYKEAIPELEQAISLTSEEEADGLYLGLGRAYLNLGQIEKGTQALEKAMEISPGPAMWNSVAYFFSLSKIQLDRAQQYAESAVTAVATDLRNVELGRLTLENVQNAGTLAAYWDTLGWVHFQKGDVNLAEKYITAAWSLHQNGEVGDHLGQIMEKLGKKAEAIRLYAFAEVADQPVTEAKASLNRLVEKDKLAALLSKAKEDFNLINTVPLGPLLKNQKDFVEAEFYVVLVPGPAREAQVIGVKFIKGDEKLRPFTAALKGASFKLVFPDDTITKVVRRGVLMCQPKDAACSFMMVNPQFVDSLD